LKGKLHVTSQVRIDKGKIVLLKRSTVWRGKMNSTNRKRVVERKKECLSRLNIKAGNVQLAF